ncbi:protein lin-54 homolog [Anopheles maculipalpis]|uniref:protein lin-54 homolog n=1 Tax=Anopheles maculipalpis TaxID=1496333 RepID=UPI0021597D5F|nr:protein lin-54 homolog [Anopheles maculipalpis]
MEELRDIEDETYHDSQDFVEYATEDEPDEMEHGTMNVDLDELVEETHQQDVSTDEEYENYKDDEKPRLIEPGNNSSKQAISAFKNSLSIPRLQKIGNSSGTGRTPAKVVVLPQGTSIPTTTTPMKLLNTSRSSLTPTMATTSYRLLNSEGTMIVNVSNKPTTVKKLISVANPTTTSLQNPATGNRVVLNTKAPVMHIQPTQTISTSTGTGLKTITMKTIPGGTLKMVPQTGSLTAGMQGTVLRMTKPTAGQTVSLTGSAKVIKPNTPNSGNEAPKVILNSSVAGAKKIVASTKAPLHAVTLPGGKGVQYVRLLNQRPSSTGVQKIVMQTTGKTSANIVASSASTPTVLNAVPSTSTAGTSQAAGTSKIIMPNHKTFVIRNGSTHLAASATLGKPSILSAGKKIILNTDSTGNTTRLVLAKDATKKINSIQTVVKTTQLAASNGVGVSSSQEGVNVVARKQEPEEVVKTSAKSPSQSMSGGGGSLKTEADGSKDTTRVVTTANYGFPDEAYKKRPCNCTKSQCLKLYCDCFANGEYCYNCNCKDCYNTFDHANARQKAIRTTLERNPNAFKPKIGSIGSTDDGTRLHTKGCNCKRSGCLKNYCECYEGKIPCSSNCKCIGCRNTDNFDIVSEYYSSNDASMKSIEEGSHNNILLIPDKYDGGIGNRRSSGDTVGLKRSASFLDTDLSQLPPTKQPHNFMTMDVIEATVQCMVAQADECLKRGCSMRTSELMILEEYGRCLLEIKEFAFNTEN